MGDLKQKVATATKWSTITEIAAKCCSPVVNMVLARVLAPEMFGVVATISVVVSLAEVFTDAGFQKYLIQHDFKDEKTLNEHTNVAFVANFVLSMILWAVIFLFDDPLAEMLGCAGLGYVITVSAASIPLTSFTSIQMARFKRDLDFKKLFYLRLLAVFIPLVVTIPLAFLLKNYWALIIGTLVTNGVNAIVLTAVSKWKPKFFFSFRILKEMFGYSWWILLESIFVWITSYVGTFIVGSALSSYYVGIYKTSMTTVNQIVALVTAATSSPLFVSLSRQKNDYSAMMNTYYEFIHGISVLLVPLGVGMWIYKDTVTEIMLGPQWAEATNFIGLWGLTSAATLLFGTYCNGLYNAAGKTHLSFISQLLHLVVLIPALLWAVNYGYERLYHIRSIVRLELIVVQMLIMKKCMKAKLWKMFKGTIPAIICTAIMAIAALLMRPLHNAIWWELVTIAICVAVYFSALYFLWKRKLADALSLFGINIRFLSGAKEGK